MQPNVDLRLIADALRQLAATPYFDPEVLAYSEHLCRAIEFALNANPRPAESAMQALAKVVWLAHQYLAGSISREAPYEVEYCLKLALDGWKKKPCLITTGLIDAPHGYCFYQVDPWEMIQKILPEYDAKGFDPTLVLIGVPRLYRHKPLFCIPLYHELGHFVDRHWGVTNLTSLLGMSSGITMIPPLHYAEHFADTFCASYVGESAIRTLEAVAPSAAASQTHPSTADRVAVMRAFLEGRRDARLDILMVALTQLKAPVLQTHFAKPNVYPAFDDLLPYQVQSEAELHGLFNSAWLYFENTVNISAVTWTGKPMHEGEIESAINDLTEKSIRNYSVIRKWENAVINT